MGGLGPGIGGMEYVVIAIVALLVVGPERLPMLLRKVGQMVAKARNMANEFRASFDEMARQSELDDLRKEVEALRSGQGMYALGADADEAFKDIRKELEAPLEAPSVADPVEQEPTQIQATGVDEWPDSATPVVAPKPVAKAAAKPRAKKASTASNVAAPKAKARKATPKSDVASPSLKPPASRPKVKRTKKVDL